MMFSKGLLVALAFIVSCSVAAAVNVHNILVASDAVRNPDKSFSLTVTLIEYRNNAMVNTSSMMVYSKPEHNNKRFRTLVRFLTPARDLNKLMLKQGNNMWFFDPTSKATIRISPQQRLLGQAANGDVLTVNLAADYTGKLVKQEDIEDGDRKIRHCYKLKLVESSPDVTYHTIELWVETASYRPVKAKFYSESNRLLKTAFYRGYQQELGRVRPTETIIIDGLNPTWVTIMRYSDYKLRDIKDEWFQRDYLSHFNPDR